MDAIELARRTDKLHGGKRVGGSIYLHIDFLGEQDLDLLSWLKKVAREADYDPGWNVVKLKPEAARISLLCYPKFRSEPHPALRRSLVIDLRSESRKARDYSGSRNPPILHRKECFLSNSDPDYERFRSLTVAEEFAGLLTMKRRIGFQQEWTGLLTARGLTISDHHLAGTRRLK